jgi:hypothetical protein
MVEKRLLTALEIKPRELGVQVTKEELLEPMSFVASAQNHQRVGEG